MTDRNNLLLQVIAALRANDGIGSWQEAVATVEQLLDREGKVEERERQLLRECDGFCDMVVREAEQTILTASIDELVVFAYGEWDEARTTWRRRQRRRFRTPRLRPAKVA